MNKRKLEKWSIKIKSIWLITVLCVGSNYANAQAVLEKEVLISNTALYFDGVKVSDPGTAGNNGAAYDRAFGDMITPHGDCIKTFNEYVFMTWYKGGKEDRHVMLTRYNTKTGSMKTIQFPHRHTGFQNRWWIGEAHNAIAIGICPLDSTIHMIYDMHSYSATRPADGSLSEDYFRYSYSKKNAATVSDSAFTLNQFVQNAEGGYKHLSLNNAINYAAFSALTYPHFFLNDSGELFMWIREGGHNNGAYKFTKYDADKSTWSEFTQFNILDAQSHGASRNWGLYGDIKYVDGKIRIGFQRRLANGSDKYIYQNGVYYTYSDDQSGKTNWKTHNGTPISIPLINADDVKVFEPGDLVQTTAKDKVQISADFDWTVTDNGDVHFIGTVKDVENKVTVHHHTYKKNGEAGFTTKTNLPSASNIYSSGKNIYIIGLSNNRPFVEKAEGGTNNFSRIFTYTGSRKYRGGVVYISNGKVYYYLMEQKSGSAQPIYLQIIDLLDDTLSTTTAIKLSTKINKNNLMLYPNPVTHVLNVDFGSDISSGNDFKNARLQISDVSGKTVLSKIISSSTASIDVSGFHNGLYLIQVTNGIYFKYKTFIKQ